MLDLRFYKLLFLTAAVCLNACSCSERTESSYPLASLTEYNVLTDEGEIGLSECRIDLGDIISVAGRGAWLCGNEISITEGGIYVFTGTTQDGQIYVDTDDAVKLVFNGATIRNSSGYAVTSNAGALIIEAFGSSTLIGCGGEYKTAVYSEGDTFFVGKGRIYLDGGVLSSGEIVFRDNEDTGNRSVTVTDSGENVIGSFVLN